MLRVHLSVHLGTLCVFKILDYVKGALCFFTSYYEYTAAEHVAIQLQKGAIGFQPCHSAHLFV